MMGTPKWCNSSNFRSKSTSPQPESEIDCPVQAMAHFAITPFSSPAHIVLAQACVVTLCSNDRVNREIAWEIRLVSYAARYRFDLARFGNLSLSIRDTMEYFFGAEKPHWTDWCRVQTMDEWWGWFTPDEGEYYAFPSY